MYKVRDIIFDNRQVIMQDLSVVRFVNSWAEVPDKYIHLFKSKDYAIGEHISIDKIEFEAKMPTVEEEVKKIIVDKQMDRRFNKKR